MQMRAARPRPRDHVLGAVRHLHAGDEVQVGGEAAVADGGLDGGLGEEGVYVGEGGVDGAGLEVGRVVGGCVVLFEGCDAELERGLVAE